MNRYLSSVFKTILISTVLIFGSVLFMYILRVTSTYTKIQAVTYQMSADISRHNYLTDKASTLFDRLFDDIVATDDLAGGTRKSILDDILVDITYNNTTGFRDVNGNPVNYGESLKTVRDYGDAHTIVVKLEYRSFSLFSGTSNSGNWIGFDFLTTPNRYMQYEYVAPCLRYIKDGTNP